MNNYRNSAARPCGCGSAEPAAITGAVLPVMVQITVQQWDCVYPADRALSQGTLFPALDKPFFGKGGCCCE